ncbi:HNH endonuclease [Priestia megaterium]|uniref:HNH endonuclease n=1 Tax=Priestia megaterium TaxID=1404 RepID=UPI00406BAFE3
MRCIICKQLKENLTEEHIFPDAIGGTLTLKNVCKECNNKLGHSVDHHLVDNWFIQAERLSLKLRGKSGKLPNPLGNGVLKENPKQKVRYHFNSDGNPREVYLVPHIEKETKDDDTEIIKISIDRKDKDKLPGIINKISKRYGKPELSYEQIEKQVHEETILTPSIEMQLTMDIVQYKRAILKIAYELAYYWLGDEYFNDSIGERIRKCILDDNFSEDFSSSYSIKSSIDLIGEQSIFNFRDEEPKNHIAFMIVDGHQINCYVRIFSIFEGLIQVSEEADKYSNFEGKFISLNPILGVIKETTYLEAMARTTPER